MRVAFISTMRGCAWGGSEELWFEAAKEAVKQGHEVFASVGHWGKTAPKLHILESLGVKLHFQGVSRRNLQSTDIIGRLGAKIKQMTKGEGYDFAPIGIFKPDVICISQANTQDAPRFPHLRDFLDRQNSPYIVICHGHEDIPFSEDEGRRATKLYFEKAFRVGFVAQALINSIERHLADSVPNGFVIRNPVNLSNTFEIPFPSTVETIRFAGVGRLESYQKGQDILFEALSGENWRNRNWQLSLAGEGPHLVYLQDLAKHYGIGDKVKFLGQVSDISKLWSEHHLLMLPSRYEGTPLTLVEAMLCARPAVVTDVAGNCEWVTDEVNGFVAAAPSAKSIGEALERAWNKKSHWKEMGAVARTTALKQYPENSGAVLLDLLTGAIRA
jgi:glycosyltransferase involved in cell wall biosynthesis